ncbi:EamA/RhaT family transporter, type 5 [Arcobacter venerupis]|uniref:EamA/RhaT family transporter, type 5 n=1 Tax=Arcobacter venerupis TaxID=1054033 RepID=A0AAE7E4C8_9BACT|nr:DMT family transporter [Arcobacter venerupis]QKF68183.1 EamA/RhaT family transporter, type 5 [Arcobacter venerupis]RWS48567.1 EamA family transporter [Arcobacter venerupis]
MKSKLYELRADLLLLSVAIAWGVTFLMVQDAINTTPVYAFLFFRFAIASILMFFIAFKFLNQINKKTIFYGIILGIFLFSAFATQTFGLSYTKSSIVAFITGLNVICVPFLAYFIFKDHIKRNVLIATFIAVIGLYLLTMSGALTIGKGELLTLICAFLFALQIIYTGKFSKEVNVFLLVLFQLITVTVLSLGFSLLLDNVTFNLTYDYAFFKAVLITAIFATVYAFLIQTYMQQFTSATKTAIIFAMEPVSASIFAFLAVGELLTNIQISGAILIVLATIIAEVKFKSLSHIFNR